MTQQVELSTPSFLWLSSAGISERTSVFESLRKWALPDLKSRKTAYPHVFIDSCVLEAKAHHPSFQIAFWRSAEKVLWVVDIAEGGGMDADELAVKLRYLDLAKARLSAAATFDLAGIKSGEEFANLVDAIAGLTSAEAGGLAAGREFEAARFAGPSEGIYTRLPARLQLDALNSVIRMSAGATWGVADARQNMKAILDGARNKPQLLKRGGEVFYLLHSESFDQLTDSPTAIEDSAFFFSRRAPVEVPALSAGRERAGSLLG